MRLQHKPRQDKAKQDTTKQDKPIHRPLPQTLTHTNPKKYTLKNAKASASFLVYSERAMRRELNRRQDKRGDENRYNSIDRIE